MEPECQKFDSMITALIDNELDSVHRLEVENHLKACPKCNHHYLQETRVKKTITERLPILKAPGYLAYRIHRQLSSEKAEPSFWQLVQALFVHRPFAASIAVAALILIAVFPTYLLSISQSQSTKVVAYFDQTGRLMELQGQIFCLDCEFTHSDTGNRTPHTQAHRIGIRCSANEVWTFLETRATLELLHDDKYLEKNVLV
ncbi:MAG TPA: zf-HC2 domain-containing protein, partial [bacterium]